MGLEPIEWLQIFAQKMCCLAYLAHADHRGCHVAHYACDGLGQDLQIAVDRIAIGSARNLMHPT